MLTKSPKRPGHQVQRRPEAPKPTAVHFQAAGYIVAAQLLGVRIRPVKLDRGPRQYAIDVMDIDQNCEQADADGRGIAIFDQMGLVMLAGTHAMHRFAPEAYDRGEVECRDLVWCAIEEYTGFIMENPSALRQFNNRVAELHADAKRLVDENADGITATAGDLASSAHHPAAKA